MSNYIKIPLGVNPPRSFRNTSITIAGSRLTGGGTVGGGTTPATTGALATTVVPIGGTSATFSALSGVAGASAVVTDLTLTCSAIGEGYKVGDVISIAAFTGTANQASWTEPVTFKVTDADLIVVEGSSTNDYALLPIDNLGTVVKGSTNTEVIVELKQSNVTGTGADKVAKYTITMDDVPATDKWALQADVADAVLKAASAENSQPEVRFTNGAECISVVLS
jgi:hypothetical protein